MAAASATYNIVLTFGYAVIWRFYPQKESIMDTIMKQVTDEKMSQPADSKAVHKV